MKNVDFNEISKTIIEILREDNIVNHYMVQPKGNWVHYESITAYDLNQKYSAVYLMHHTTGNPFIELSHNTFDPESLIQSMRSKKIDLPIKYQKIQYVPTVDEI